LTTALLRLEPSCSVLTSHHLALVELAYITNNIEPALPIIEKVVVFFPVSKAPTDTRLCDMQLLPTLYITVDSGFTAKLTSRLVMQYDLLVANCFIQLRSWERAFDTLERLISYPTKDQACSKIMSEGYNKWVLVGLILNGKTPSLPSHIWSGPQKAFATLGKPYASIANAFDTKTAAELKAEFESLGPQFWSDEGNLGLMNYVLAHYQRWKILDLRQVYTKISLERIRMLTQSAEIGAALGTEAKVLELLQDMIAGGMLSGKVVPAADGKPAHLVFLPPAEVLSEAAFAAEMLRTSQRIQALAPLVNITNERLGTSRDYVRFLAGQQNGKGKGVLAEALMAFDSQIEDEDLMTGLVSGH
jgi:COP9 signalosome complex subunit 3